MSMSDLDPNLITRKEHNTEKNAKNVYLVGGESINIELDNDKLSEALKDAVEGLKIPEPTVTIPEIKVPQIDVKIPEIEVPKLNIDVIEIEKTIVVPEVKIIEVEKPVIVTETKIVEVDKPIITQKVEVVKETVFIDRDKNVIPPWVYTIFGVQFLIMLGLLYKLYIVMGY